MPTRFAGEGAGHEPYLSRPELLPSTGVICCLMSQHQHAPREPMNRVTLEQTNVMCRGAAQTSAGSEAAPSLASVPRLERRSSAFLQGTPAPPLEWCPGSALRAGVGQEWALRGGMSAQPSQITGILMRSFDLNTLKLLMRARQAEDGCAWVWFCSSPTATNLCLHNF